MNNKYKIIEWKRFVKFAGYLIIAFTFTLHFISCDEMADNYQQYLEGGEIIYPGKADSVRVFPGKYRIGLSWLILSDPFITSSIVFWNNNQDSVVIPITRTSNIDTVNIILDNLDELPYTFNVITLDDKGNRSVNNEVIGNVYGDNYRTKLLNRAISSLTYSETKGLKVTWVNADEGTVGEQIIYTKVDGNVDTICCDVATENLWLSEYDPNLDFSYSTTFIPDSMAIDTFKVAYEVVDPDIKKEEKELNRSLFSLYELPGDYSTPHTSSSVVSLIWTNPAELRDSPSYISKVNGHSFPQWFTIDLGANYELTKLTLFPRGTTSLSNSRLYAGGNLKTFEVWGSLAPDMNYNPDDHSGDFGAAWTLLQSCEVVRSSGDVKVESSTRSDNTQEDIDAAKNGFEFVLNTSEKVRYLRIKVLENWHPTKKYANIAAIDLWAIQY